MFLTLCKRDVPSRRQPHGALQAPPTVEHNILHFAFRILHCNLRPPGREPVPYEPLTSHS